MKQYNGIPSEEFVDNWWYLTEKTSIASEQLFFEWYFFEIKIFCTKLFFLAQFMLFNGDLSDMKNTLNKLEQKTTF